MRKIADEAEARRALAAVARSGQRLGSWARTHGIDGRSLHAWELAFARRGKTTVRPKPKLVELVSAAPTARSTSARYAIRLGEVVLEFGDDAQEETLRRVLEVLRSC